MKKKSGFIPLEIARPIGPSGARASARARSLTGFTLIEGLVSISILVLLTSMTLTLNRSGSEQLKLFKDEAVVDGVLNQARAMASEKSNKDPDACAFGVHFTAGSPTFILFQDLKPADGIFYCRNEADGSYKNNFQYNPAGGELVQSFDLETPSVFQIATEGVSVANGDSVDLLFVPPELDVTSTLPLPLTFTIFDAANGASKNVVINSTGQISH